MSEQNPLIRRYLEQLDSGLVDAGIADEERRDIGKDIDGHLAEALRSGTSLTDALAGLGPADELARAYSLELTLNPRVSSDGSTARWIVAALARVGALLASTLLTIVMGGVSLVLLIAGAAAVLGGIVAPFLPPEWLDPTLRAGLPQLVVVLFGVVLLVVAIPSFRLVHVNLRFLIQTMRKQLTGDSP